MQLEGLLSLFRSINMIYPGGKKKIAEHGGFAHDDTNVMMLSPTRVSPARPSRRLSRRCKPHRQFSVSSA